MHCVRNLQNALMLCERPTGEILEVIGQDNFARVLYDWPSWARDDQLPDAVLEQQPDWQTWLLMGGRGAGKTRTGAEWVRQRALGRLPIASEPATRIALIGPTMAEVRSVMVEGISGLLSVHAPHERPTFLKSLNQLVWPNGAIAQMYSAEEPDSLRGPQFDLAWCDELAKWRFVNETWDMLQFALRLGSNPQAIITTTPRPVPLLKKLLKDETTLLSHAATHANAAFLAPAFISTIERQYGGSRLGRQEINGELIEDNPNALFQRHQIEKTRIAKAPELVRIVVAVDPPVSSHKASNACGIICAGLGADGRAYVLDDATMQKAKPAGWAARAIGLYHARSADRLVVEINQGGEMVQTIIAGIDQSIAFKPARATRAKHLRAEPVAALYEQERVSHVGALPQLEDEMCVFEQRIRTGRASPDRVDALVWAITELMLNPATPAPRVSVI